MFSVSTAAWLETLVEILEYVPTQVLSQTVFFLLKAITHKQLL